MLIRPLSAVTPKKWKLIRFLSYRKDLGILSASVVVSNALYNFIPMGIDFFPYYFGSYWSVSPALIAGHLAELVAFPLLLTSNIHVQRKMRRWWKPVQRLSYIYFYGAGIFLTSLGKNDVFISMIIVTFVMAAAVIKKRVTIWSKSN